MKIGFISKLEKMIADLELQKLMQQGINCHNNGQ